MQRRGTAVGPDGMRSSHEFGNAPLERPDEVADALRTLLAGISEGRGTYGTMADYATTTISLHSPEAGSPSCSGRSLGFAAGCAAPTAAAAR